MNWKECKALLQAKGITDGCYVRLLRDVENPEADRRVRYDWTLAPTVSAGKRFRVRFSDDFGASLSPLKGRAVSEHTKLFAALLPELEVVAENVYELLERYNLDGARVVAKLIADGVVQQEQVAAVAAALEADDLAQEDL
jgi:hypothetical protein